MSYDVVNLEQLVQQVYKIWKKTYAKRIAFAFIAVAVTAWFCGYLFRYPRMVGTFYIFTEETSRITEGVFRFLGDMLFLTGIIGWLWFAVIGLICFLAGMGTKSWLEVRRIKAKDREAVKRLLARNARASIY